VRSQLLKLRGGWGLCLPRQVPRPRRRRRRRRRCVYPCAAAGPARPEASFDGVLQPVCFAVEGEVPVSLRVASTRQQHQQRLAKLERCGKLPRHLPDGVQPLHEYRRHRGLLSHRGTHPRLYVVPAAARELVAHQHPLAAHQRREALEGAVVGVQQQRCQRHQLRRSGAPFSSSVS
jgi:hypothetical protein